MARQIPTSKRPITTALCVFAFALVSACSSGEPSTTPSAASPGTGGEVVGAPTSAPAHRGNANTPASLKTASLPTLDSSARFADYPWLSERRLGWPEPVGPLSERFAPPAGFARVPLASGSFGAWLRALPLAAEGSEVRSFRGGLVREAGHPNVAAVAALDVGSEDVQQCADSIMRLHAEWRWSRGDRAMSYRAASGVAMPYQRWAQGERPVAEGLSLRWTPRAPSGDGYRSFRAYMTEVSRYANTGSVSVQGAPVAPGDVRPGDFFVLPGGPGHAVMIVDLAVDGAGRRAALIAQGFMPAQSFHVLRPEAAAAAAPGGAWFLLDPEAPGVKTPFWPTFPWSSLRRLDA
jgi:hypothetical protein